MGHWHVATGLVGYGPAGSDGYGTATDMPTLADLIAEECRRAASSETDAADSLGEDGDYKAAWETHKRAESLDNMARTFDNGRANAPLYRGRPDMWHDTVRTMAGVAHLTPLTDNTRLYVWECDNFECD